MALNEKLSIGDHFLYNGDMHKVEGFDGGAITIRSSHGTLATMNITAILSAPDFKLLDRKNYEQVDLTTLPTNVPKKLIEKAKKRREHLFEALTGYKTGDPLNAKETEPKEFYDSALTTLTQRMDTKAKELKMSSSALWKQKKAFETWGLIGLIDQRLLRGTGTSARVSPRIREGINKIYAELTEASNISMASMMRRVERWLKQEYPDEEVEMPSQPTFNALLRSLDRGLRIFDSAKSRREVAGRPRTPYGKLVASRPGEIVIIDTTTLDAFAIDPVTMKWIQVQFTMAYDLYTRSMLDWRFTPVSTKAVDAALLLYGTIQPKLMRDGWPENARWPYVGIPECIALDLMKIESPDRLANGPVVNPETVVVDRGKIYISEAFMAGCTRLEINIQLARPYTPTDKAHIESVFKTVRFKFVENLPGYKGPDLFSRGRNIEGSAFYFIDEIERYFAEWVAIYWHKRHHRGLLFPEVPRLHLSPNDLYEEGLAKAGFIHVVPDQRLYYELLPTEWRTIQHYGVEVHGLLYDGDILEDYRDTESPYKGENTGKWPIRYDPREKSEMYFYDPSLERWYPLYWTGALYPLRPFDDTTLSYAKFLVKERGGNPRNHNELKTVLNELLNRMDDLVFANQKERKTAAKRAVQAQLSRSERPDISSYSLLGPDDEAYLGGLALTGQVDYTDEDAEITEDDLRKVRKLLETVGDDEKDDLDF